MRDRNYLYYLLVILAAGLLLLVGCYPGQKLAKNYIEQDDYPEFIVLSPSFIYKENLKKYLVDSVEERSTEEIDSLLFFRSTYLKEVDDSLYLAKFTSSLISNMNALDLKTYGEESLDSLMSTGKEGYVLNIAQILMEEYVTPYEPEAVVYDEVVTPGAIDLNAVNISTWFELSRMNPSEEEDAVSKVLFASDEVTDNMQGQFVQYFLSGVVYEYTMDTLKTDDLYKAANLLGYKYSMYMYDYLLNRYILKQDPSLAKEELYYHYDPQRQKAYPITEGFRFTELDR